MDVTVLELTKALDAAPLSETEVPRDVEPAAVVAVGSGRGVEEEAEEKEEPKEEAKVLEEARPAAGSVDTGRMVEYEVLNEADEGPTDAAKRPDDTLDTAAEVADNGYGDTVTVTRTVSVSDEELLEATAVL
ncbi:MAG: hypothetical protein Q9222_005852 [Ikaeria aurantiellina]